MPMTLYDPIAKAWVNTNPYPDSGMSSQELLLINVLIELRIHTQYLAAMNTGIVLDDPQTLRVDEASSWPVNG